MGDVILRAKDISLEYKTRVGLLKEFRHKALDSVSFEINRGEVLGIVGGNGSGKSTLLKVLSGVLCPDSGSIWMPKGTTRSLLSLGLGFNAELSGRDNVVLSSMFNGYSKRDSIELASEIKDFSGLGEFFENPVRIYSSGMRSKLGFSAGIITHVDILMVDEVLAVGDHEFREKAENAMLDKIGGKNQTVLFVSHNENQIKRVCTRSLDLDNSLKETLYTNDDFQPLVSSNTSLEIKLPASILKLVADQNIESLKVAVGGDPDWLRDVAICFEDNNLSWSIEFMTQAHKLRPEGVYIEDKLSEYKARYLLNP